MPKSDKHSTIARQWQMLKWIPSRPPGITVRELCNRLAREGFPVTMRTVERDLESLSSLFYLTNEQDSSSRAKRWYYAIGKVPEMGSVDLIDAVSLSLSGDVLETLLPGALLQPVAQKIAKARTKLKAMSQVGLARWSEKVRYVHGSLEMLPPRIAPATMDAVKTALLENRQIELTYDAFNQKPKALRLHPLCLVLRGSVPYLVATAFDYDDPRLYAVHRMRKVGILDEPVIPPKGFSIDAFLKSGAMDFEPGKLLKLKARLSDELAMYLTETPLSKDQKIDHRKGHYQLTATVQDSWQLHFWLLSQGAGLTVLGPKALRQGIEQSLREALEGYTS